jgi:DNA polymerase III gamma/tau subunit
LATGSLDEAQPAFDALFGALVSDDAVGALRSLAVLSREGWDPEQLAENFAGEVRQVFLLQVAPDVADAVDADRERLSKWGRELGLAKSVRVLETVGRAIREMKSAPEKIVMLEVAMVRLTKPELDHSFESLDERLTRLERGPTRSTPTPPPPPPAPALRPIGSSVTPAAPPPSAPSTLAPGPASTPSIVHDPPPAPESATTEGVPALSLDDVRVRFVERVVPRTSRSAQLLLRSAKIESLEGLLITIAVQSEEMRQNTELISQGLKGALEHEFKAPLTIFWTVDTSLASAPIPERRETPKSAPIDEEFEGGEETVLLVNSAADHLITEMFPGSEEIS